MILSKEERARRRSERDAAVREGPSLGLVGGVTAGLCGFLALFWWITEGSGLAAAAIRAAWGV